MVATTSRLAYREHEDAGQVGKQASEILAFMLRRRADWSRSELAEELVMRLSSVCGRVNELMEAGKIVHAPMRKCRVTGRKVNPVKLCAR